MSGLTKKILIFIVVMAAVAAFGWFGRKAWKHYTERNLLAQAHADFVKSDLHDADLCLRRVLQINPMSIEGSRMIANLLDAENSAASVSWRIRVAKLEPNNVTNRFAWVETALRAQNLPSAAEALSGIPDKYKGTADYHKLAGAVAWSSGRVAEAEQECSVALQMDPTNRSMMLNLATIQLAITNQAVNQQGRATLNQLASDPGVGMMALHHLQVDAVAHKEYQDALAYSRQINTKASATFSDKIDYLQLLRMTKSTQADTWQASLEQIAAYEPQNAYALGHWMNAAKGPKPAYQWLCSLPATTQTNLIIQLIKTDCLIGTKDWNGLLAAVQPQSWGQRDFYREALISLGQRSLGETTESQVSWERALHLAAEQPQNLALLAEVTGTWGWLPERTQTLQEAMDKFPEQKWAADQMTAQLYRQGDTQGLVDLMTKMQAANPEDPRLKNNLADVLMLRRVELDKAYRLAAEAYQTATNNPFYISTYAYSLLLQNRPDEAQKIIVSVRPDYLKIPSVAAYYGVIEVQTGHKVTAREPLARAQKANLLPEEKAIVQYAIGQL